MKVASGRRAPGHGLGGIRLLRPPVPLAPDRGVTGTNGKTTVTQLVRSILEADGRPTGVIGTLGGARTTPESPDLQRQLAELVADGTPCRGHGGVVPRPDPAPGGRDRLRRGRLHQPESGPPRPPRDHGELLRGQGSAVRTRSGARHAVVFADDPWGARLLERLEAGTAHRRAARRGERRRARRRVDPGSPGGATGSTFRCPGRFNVDNALVAAAVATALGVDEDTGGRRLASAPAVPGRMEVVGCRGPGGGGGRLRPHAGRARGGADAPPGRSPAAGRVLCVFGCGGDRDPGKRPEMGAVASTSGRRGGAHLGQPTVRGPDGHHRGGPGRHGRPAPTVTVEPDRAAAIR